MISVGNLVLGGTGKTPTVIYLAKLLKDQGFKPCIVSRGYGGKSKRAINVVSDGRSILMNVESAGDEPVLIAESLADIPIITGKKRILPCEYAVTHLGVDIIILDDGFQHMGVSRDINLVLFDASTLAGNSRIFPAGPLREPIAALNRTTGFLITGQNKENKKRSDLFAELLRSKFPHIPVFMAKISHPVLKDKDNKTVDGSLITDAYVFCAIANPDRVNGSVASLGINSVGSKAYPDHRTYSQKTITSLCMDAALANAKCLITTSKDFVKVMHLQFTLPLYVLHIKQEPESDFNDYLLKNISHNR